MLESKIVMVSPGIDTHVDVVTLLHCPVMMKDCFIEYALVAA
jgi:hypothetical protein